MRGILLFLIFLVELVFPKEIDVSKFQNYEMQMEYNIIIGDYTYHFLKPNAQYFEFAMDRFDIPINIIGPYPLNNDSPKIIFNQILMKTIGKKIITNLENQTTIINGLIQSVETNRDLPIFVLENGLCLYISNPKLQVFVVWNSRRTYLMITSAPSSLSYLEIDLGRGIGKYDLSGDIPFKNDEDDVLVYEISTNRMILKGCQENKVMTSTNQLSLNKYIWSPFGGDDLTLQGPCSVDTELKLEIISLTNPNQTFPSISIPQDKFDNTKKTINILTPSIWNSGIYELRLANKKALYTTRIEIYHHESINQKYELNWEESNEMNNPDFKKEYIKLTASVNSKIVSSFLYILNISKAERNQYPLQIVSEFSNDGSNFKIISVSEINFSKIDIYNHIGIFCSKLETKELIWSKPFTFIWLTSTISATSKCNSTLSRPKSPKPYNCPANAFQAENLRSIFRKLEDSGFMSLIYIKDYDCFVKVFPDFVNEDGQNTGVTCCYFKNTKYLVYGQNFYLDKNFFGSYSWTISPYTNLLKHFLNYQMPILLCCAISKNEENCSNYWEKQSSIVTIDYDTDIRADIFGDPHIISYESKYFFSFLDVGQYNLIETSQDFSLQGRFFANDGSFLKAIALAIPGMKMVITMSTNKITSTKWKILMKLNNESVDFILPYQNENIFIFQTNDDTDLQMYITYQKDYKIYIDLERLYYQKKNVEYINMKIEFSNNFKTVITGGLLGKFDRKDNSVSLYRRNSSEPLNSTELTILKVMHDFTRTWELDSNSVDLFFDLKLSNKSRDFHFKNYENFTYTELDDNFFTEKTVSVDSKKAYDDRLVWDGIKKQALSLTRACDYPPWNLIRLDSTYFALLANVTVTKCLNRSFDLKNIVQILTCVDVSGKLKWHSYPPIEGDMCIKHDNPNIDPEANKNVILYASIGGSIAFLVIVLLIVGFFVIRRKRRVQHISQNQLEMSSGSTIPLDDIYDNDKTREALQDNYATYSTVVKADKTET